MKERFLESLAILLAGLFSAERLKQWQLGDAAPRPQGSEPRDAAAARGSNRSES